MQCILLSLPLKDSLRFSAVNKQYNHVFQSSRHLRGITFKLIPMLTLEEFLLRLHLHLYRIFRRPRRPPNVNYLHVCFPPDVLDENVVKVMDYVMNFNIEELILLSNHGPTLFRAFQCFSNLLILRIKGFSCYVSGSWFSPNIKVINIESSDIPDYDLRALVEGCRVLMVLDVRRCNKLSELSFKAPNLRSLTMANCRNASRITLRGSTRLERLIVHGKALDVCDIGGHTGINEIYLDLIKDRRRCRFFIYWEIGPMAFNLRVLTLCDRALVSAIAVLEKNCLRFRGFRQLTELSLIMRNLESSNLRDIRSFFGRYLYPELQILKIELPMFGDGMTSLPRGYPARFPKLKTMNLWNFKYLTSEMTLLNFLLKNVVHLDELSVVVPRNSLQPTEERIAEVSSMINQHQGPGVIEGGYSVSYFHWKFQSKFL